MKTIKVPTPRQLPSGNWFLQISLDGRRVSVTEPTEEACIARALALRQDMVEAVDKSSKPTLSAAIDRYIASRQNILSPATIRGYRTIQKHRFQSAMSRPINAYDQNGWQRLVNQEAKIVSAKTLRNAWLFLSSVIHEETGSKFRIQLPQVVSDGRAFLEPEQIDCFLEAIYGSAYELPALLALCSLRRSELIALTWDKIDLATGTMKIHGSMVPDETGAMVLKKENKNRSSRRIVPIMIPRLKELLDAADRSSTYVVTMKPSAILNGINRICAKSNLPPVGMHGLRHSFASLAYHLGMPEKVAMQIGGWENDATMKKIYTHVAKNDILKYQNVMSDYYAGQR